MVTCCECDGIKHQFGHETAQKELKRFRRKGPIPTTRLLIEDLQAAGIANGSLLDIGGGVGALHHILLDRDVSTAIHVDVSSAYLEVAQSEATRRGHVAVRFIRGDFVELAAIGVMFALFEGLMPAVGLVIGRGLSATIGNTASYVAGGILIALGAWEIREAIGDDDNSLDDRERALTRSTWLLGLSVSLDELVIGFGLGVVGTSLGTALTYIALQALGVTFLGLAIGARVGRRLQERAELAAGILLVLLGIGIVIST